jgi:neurotransmitter:Na+ symporter, NSS family
MSGAPREQWGTRLGFMLAAVGSAVGLGNMWRFPYYTAENGGAAFLFLYLFMTVLIGLPVMLAEFTIGRGAKKSPIQALVHFGGRSWKPLGFLFVGAGFLILSYYGVIAGWTARYLWEAVVRGFGPDAAGLFQQVSGGWAAVGWQLAFMAATVVIVAGGVKSGIERSALILMPILFLVVCGLALYAATLPGAGAGYAYYLKADFSEIFSVRVLSQAAGQAFFSLSLGMGAMLTFASYLSRDTHLPSEAVVIASSDFLIAFIAGLTVFPLIFALNLAGQVGESTVGALFITLPQAFAGMEPAGRVVGILFFGALAVGALTSAISLLEVVTASAMDGLGWTRRKGALILGGLITVLGVPSAMNLDILGLVDQVAEGIFLVGGALGLAVFVGYIMKDPVGEIRNGAAEVRWFPAWRMLLRYVVPPLLLIVFVTRLRDLAAALRSLLGG